VTDQSPDMMQSSNMYNQAIRAARRLRRLQVRYGDQASYPALLVEWMNGLFRSIHLNEDHIQQDHITEIPEKK